MKDDRFTEKIVIVRRMGLRRRRLLVIFFPLAILLACIAVGCIVLDRVLYG